MILAARGSRNLDTGEEKIQDPAMTSALRRQARGVHVKSLLAGALLTVLFLVISR